MKAALLLLLFALLTPASAEPPGTRQSPPYVPPVIASRVQNVTPAEAEKLLAERKDLTVLDLRTADEFAAGHLAGAKNVDFLDPNFAKNLSAFAGKPVVIHCASGTRSTKALRLIGAKNFPQVYHLQGGYAAWSAAGKPVVSDSVAPK